MKHLMLMLATFLLAIPAIAQISESEKAALQFMREEEKLAHDFYASMVEKWNSVPFTNIVKAEKRHMQLVKEEFDRFKIPDPLDGIAEKQGVFRNERFKEMYDQFMASGNGSFAGALQAGALIEETDLNDLTIRLKETSDAGIRSVYNRLIQASENHLRAFVRNLEVQGQSYAPQVLDKEYYDQIINAPQGQGRKAKGRGRAG